MQYQFFCFGAIDSHECHFFAWYAFRIDTFNIPEGSSAAHSSAPQLCPVGYYCTGGNRFACTATGTYVDVTGYAATSCKIVIPGYYGTKAVACSSE